MAMSLKQKLALAAVGYYLYKRSRKEPLDPAGDLQKLQSLIFNDQAAAAAPDESYVMGEMRRADYVYDESY